MSFHRHKLFYHRSLAYRLFKRHHTHFNDIYWSHKTVLAHTFSSTAMHSTSDPASALFNKEKGTSRGERELGTWAGWYNDFDSWTRMASVVAIAGYLETYIAQVATAAMESNPSLVFGGGPDIDGATFLKHNDKYDLYDYTEPLTRGDWQSRVSAYKKIFGSCPFEHRISDLEKLRRLRNDAGHSFGRDIKSMKFAGDWQVKKLTKISDKKLELFLELVETVAESIEKQVASKYIGQYELVKAYHNWLKVEEIESTTADKLVAKRFSAYVFEMTSNPYPAAKHLMSYYDAL
ncbi:hypothetical protein [Vibrio parahaemolyticus]|uniref:hypothetical protein n=1 Tax=Vibrio parahaemolyticus TaxID=670 RepID=UPI0004103496|nr:hypothetical protein [Vibrio parahaemolyticus]